MAGGLLNLVAVGNQNVFLTGNPKKTFFKFVYAKYTNFGLQKFRIDYNGTKIINTTEKTQYSFKIPRYADLFMDTFLVLKLPHIWSPLFYNKEAGKYIPYEFQWIENLGTQIIQEITITCGGETLQRINGQYLTAMMQRDFTNTKKDLYNRMTGNTVEFNDPSNYGRNRGYYPNAIFSDTPGKAQPSIIGRNLYIPINVWFTLSSKMAFPLISLQYNELYIHVILRPVKEWFSIRQVSQTIDDLDPFSSQTCTYPRIQPNFNDIFQQFYIFIQPPPKPCSCETSFGPIPENCEYEDQRTDWNADVHLISTYVFLIDDERRMFAANPQRYLIKSIYEYTFQNLSESARIEMDSLGMVSSWTFFLRRSDANLRNEWSNYTNWPYRINPLCIQHFPVQDNKDYPADLLNLPIYSTGPYDSRYIKNVLLDMAILLDGKYRENMLESGIYNYIEKYLRTTGNGPDGLYCYNFCINGSRFDLQPSGAINLSKFNTIEFELTTITPPLDSNAQVLQICDPSSNEPIGVNKPTWRIYEYTYDLFIYEERYNMLEFESGNCGLMYAR